MSMQRFLTAIQLLFLSAAVVLEYLCGRFMTMMRIMLYKNRIWQEALPLSAAYDLAGWILLGGTALCLALRRKSKDGTSRRELLTLGALTGGVSLFILLGSVETVRSYYVSAALLLLIIGLQAVKLHMKRH